MSKFEKLDLMIEKNNGYLKTAEALKTGISKMYFGAYVKERKLERVAHGLYISPNAWIDEMYAIQFRYPLVTFSHETALYLLNIAEREPLNYSVTMETGRSTTGLKKQSIKVYTVKKICLT